MTEDPVVIPVGGAYNVLIGTGLWDRLGGLLGDQTQRVLLIHAPGVRHLIPAIEAALRQGERKVVVVETPDAEQAKTATVLTELWSTLGQHDFTRSDAVVAVGGGATTDLGGYVAASWLRGVRVIQVPTTLLGMVDAAVGGKTGINTAEGKNLVGAFHEPAAVLIDPSVLETLPARDLVAGLAEVIKCGFIADPVILELIEADPQAALAVGGEVLRELIQRAVQVKAEVVAADLRESSLREILNYGHTFAHAIEHVENYTWRHGDAVAVGMVYVAELAHRAGLLDESLLARHRAVLSSVGLPFEYGGAADFEALMTAMRRDKKTRGSLLRFVVLDGDVARPTRLEGPEGAWLRGAYDAVRAS
ncbi:3-dehydroquinate synthase [Demetria terragena]|uniref:3-dehydroquinate synthase n=1 Tax=Demetria terragena TaxID=63959 RepID=UPI00036048CF|nr:3-dehydroquinate synthase [Demetria terragena]